ncbi:MAG: patatin-like phospholipase family protein [Elusimicrobiota bacterium]|jgi:NTE family protein|nr:patatin-like phospholipase family protein [Elusimicrobiota bacterium]
MKRLLIIALALAFLPCRLSAVDDKRQDALLRDFLWSEFISLPAGQRPKIGLTLSAGGVRGFSHVGAMQVLIESGLPVDYISGTSMGCIIGSFYASGMPIERMWDFVNNPELSVLSKDLNVLGFLKFLFGNKLFSSENFGDFISKEVGGVFYENLPVKLACVSADIKTGERVVFDSGPVARGVRASMNLPGIFAPVEFRQRYLVDGGVVDYMPTALVKDMGADWVLAVYALPDYARSVPSTILGYVVRTGDIRGALITENSERTANFLIGSRVGDIDFRDKTQAAVAAEIGLKTAYEALGDMKDNLLLFSVDYVIK